MLGNGFYKLKSLEAGTPAAREVYLKTRFFFAMEVRGSEKLILGNKGEPQRMEEKWQVLMSDDVSSLVIDSLCDQTRGQNSTVACFYFDYVAQNEQSPTNMLGSLLKQLVCGQEEIPEEISRAYRDQQNAIGGRGLQLSDIVKMLQAISSKKPTFICIDALDECAEGHRVKVLDSLNQILQGSPSTRIFITGRLHVVPEIGGRLARRVTSVSISPKRDDIIAYLRSKLDEDTNPDAMDSSLEADILKKIPEDVSEMYVEAAALPKLPKLFTNRYISRFLLVSLNIDAILQETTIYYRRQRLNAMTDGLGLGGAYGATLGRITGQGGRKAKLGMATLMWISHAERPLKPDELCHALAVEIGSPDFNADNIPPIATVLACCQGLVVVDKEASTIRLIHFSLKEYLQAYPEHFGAAHSTIAETCLSYLNSQQIKALSRIPFPDLLNIPFLRYSSLHWGIHAKKDLSDSAKLLALKFFDDCSNHISTKILLKAEIFYYYNPFFNEPPVFSGLHCASLFGIDEIVAGLVEVEGCDINQNDCAGNTPLVWAARNGHEGVVKILLGQDDISPDKPGEGGQTPLYCATKKGHEGVVKILLGRRDVNPNKIDLWAETPLYCAAENGHEELVKILLGRRDVNPNQPNFGGKTPLEGATRRGHTKVMALLQPRTSMTTARPKF